MTDAVRLVSWDVDGMLYSNSRVCQILMKDLLLSPLLRRRPHNLKTFWDLVRWRRRVETLRRTEPGNTAVPPMGPDVLEWYLSALRRTGPQWGLLDVLDFLRRTRVPQITWSDHPAQEKLQILGVKGYFEDHLCGAQSGCLKPDPRPLRRLIERRTLVPSSVLHIGDRAECDRVAAERVGCQTLILGEDFASLANLLHHLREMRRRGTLIGVRQRQDH